MSAIAARITAVDTFDVRFPTSRDLAGSDATNPDPDRSAACVVLRTGEPGEPGEPEGHGFAFTAGRGDGVRATAVGAVVDAVRDPAAGRAALEARRPTGRPVGAEETAAAVARPAGPLSGTALAVDGGMQGLRLRPVSR